MLSKDVTSYTDLLYSLQTYKDTEDKSYPQETTLPTPQDGQILYIDLDQRYIESPQFLSVQYDHNSEIVYFKCARYLDNVDLATKTCVVQYVNANGESGIQWVPYFDLSYYEIDETTNEIIPMIVFPWSIEGAATAYAGEVTFNVRFYELAEDKSTFRYSMNTQPATSEVLHGMDLADKSLKVYYDPTDLEGTDPTTVLSDADFDFWKTMLANISTAQSNATTYWTDI